MSRPARAGLLTRSARRTSRRRANARGGSSSPKPRRTRPSAWPKLVQRGSRQSRRRRGRRTRNAEARPADLKSAGSDRTPRCRPSARDVGNAIGITVVRPRYDQQTWLVRTCPLVASVVHMMGESRACHRSPVEAPVLLPQLRRGRLRLSRSRSFHRRVTQYTPRRGLGRHVSARHLFAGRTRRRTHVCQWLSITASARRASAPPSLGCSGGRRRRAKADFRNEGGRK
jgi:hypothetical protein